MRTTVVLDTWVFTRSGLGRFAFLPQQQWLRLRNSGSELTREYTLACEVLEIRRCDRYLEITSWEKCSASACLRQVACRKVNIDAGRELHALLAEWFDHDALPTEMQNSMEAYFEALLGSPPDMQVRRVA